MLVFTTPWAEPCKRLIAALNELGVVYEEINIEERPDEAFRFDIRAVPTIVNDEGEKKVGNPPLPILKDWLEGFDGQP